MLYCDNYINIFKYTRILQVAYLNGFYFYSIGYILLQYVVFYHVYISYLTFHNKK